MAVRTWTREELLLTFNLYLRLPFGKMHLRNSDVIALAQWIGRTPSAVAMKLVNFASFDPYHKERNIAGLKNASRHDRAIWEEFNNNPEQLAFECEQIYEQQQREGLADRVKETLPEYTIPKGETEQLQVVRTRLVQSFFRRAVLSLYEYRCAMCDLGIPALMVASHIIPWSKDVGKRADPSNGLALCSLHDRAFDRGLLSVREDFTVELSEILKQHNNHSLHITGFIRIEGKRIFLPEKFLPSTDALVYHRTHIFLH